MNKFKAVLVVVLALAASQVVAMMRKLTNHREDSEECQAETQATDADVEMIWQLSKERYTPAARCYVGCIYEKREMIVDGAFSKESMDILIEQKLAYSLRRQQIARVIVDECEAELAGVPHDRCLTGPIVLQYDLRLAQELRRLPQDDVKECKAETRATEGDVRSVWNFSQQLLTLEAKCFVGCFYEKDEVIFDGAFSNEKVYIWIEKMLAHNPEKQELARAEVVKCEAELAGVPHDRCQTGPIVRNCEGRLRKFV